MWKRILLGIAVLLGLGVLGVVGIAAYAYASFASRMSAPDTPMPDVVASTDPEVIERGRYLVLGPAHCVACHGTYEGFSPSRDADVRTLALSGGYVFDMGPMGKRVAANLTPDPATGIGERTDAELARAIRTGVLHTGEISLFMRYSAANLADEDLVAVVSYLRSLAPVSHAVPAGGAGVFPILSLMFEMTPDLSPAPAYVPAGEEPSVERGRYLAENVALCTECHRPFDMSTFEPNGPKGSGGSPEPSHGADSDMEFVPPNLTSDPSGMTGKLDEDAFVARIRAGRVHASSIMPWESFGIMTDADLRSIYRHLRSLPPAHNDLGPSYRKIGSWTPVE